MSPRATERSTADLADAAAALLSAACTVANDAANEVEGRRGERSARETLYLTRANADRALHHLMVRLPDPEWEEIDQMRTAVREGYARAAWAVRIRELGRLDEEPVSERRRLDGASRADRDRHDDQGDDARA